MEVEPAASRALDGAATAVGRPERSEGIGTLTEVSATMELWAAAAVEALLERLDARIAAVTGTTPPLVLASRATLTAERSRIGALPAADPWDEAAHLWEAIGNRYLAAYARWRKPRPTS